MYKLYLDTIKKYNENRINEIDVNSVKEALIELDKKYTKGKRTELSDEEYDRLHQIYQEISGGIIFGSSGRVKVKHDYLDLKGTIKKCHYVTAEEKRNDPGAVSAHKILYDWIADTYRMLVEAIPHSKHVLGFWAKYDGLSIILSIDENGKVTKAITRGEEDLGVDKTSFFSKLNLEGIIPDEFKGKKVGLKTECIMNKHLFDEYNRLYANNELVNARTAITSLINSDIFTDIHARYVTFVPLMFSSEGKQYPFIYNDTDGPLYLADPVKLLQNPNTLKEVIDNCKKQLDEVIPYDCDGIVVRWITQEDMKVLGRDESNYINRFEIAYKFPKDNNYTKLVDIIQDIGMLGKVSYTALVEPIKINGKVITHASLGSEDKAKELNLAKGDMVNIKYEIIPYLCIDSHCIDNRSGNEPIKLITHCPYCGTELVRNPELGCYNSNCPSRIQGKIYNFCIRTNIAGVGESLIETLYHNKLVTSIYDLFDLKNKKDEFINIDGLGNKTFKSLVDQIDTLSCTEAQVLSAVSIKGIGPKTSRNISDKYNITEIKNLTVEQLSEVPGISINKAKQILEGVKENNELIEFIIDHVKVKKNGYNLQGRIVFTGFRNPKFKEHLEGWGYEVADGVTKNTTLVIAENSNGDSSKLKKARELGIQIIGAQEAYSKFGYIS
jgi:DNA ligase (NAD+)